jgi:DNA-binding winged helix-turn-helix (wHTH) protein
VEALRDSEHPMPIEELVKKTKLQEGALRSAIQRIRSDFDAFGVTNVIENVWGEGYRLSLMPLLTARALEQ